VGHGPPDPDARARKLAWQSRQEGPGGPFSQTASLYGRIIDGSDSFANCSTATGRNGSAFEGRANPSALTFAAHMTDRRLILDPTMLRTETRASSAICSWPRPARRGGYRSFDSRSGRSVVPSPNSERMARRNWASAADEGSTLAASGSHGWKRLSLRFNDAPTKGGHLQPARFLTPVGLKPLGGSPARLEAHSRSRPESSTRRILDSCWEVSNAPLNPPCSSRPHRRVMWACARHPTESLA
jgi:hypothetical protein